MLDIELLSRLQFAFTISFHILFPTFSIGLATFLLIMEGCWLKTQDPLYLSICKFWTKIFGLTFGMGVVAGIVMEFQLGTNWAGFTKKIGSVLGPLFTYEVLTAFFIEAGFLGVMLFGWNKVGRRLHYLSTCLVFCGVTLSAFWILAANSWMQTPAGVTVTEHQFVVNSWWEVIFNPSTLSRYLHMMLSAYLSTGFAIAGICAYYLLKGKHLAFSKRCLAFILPALALLTVLQVGVGDKVGLVIHRHQPLKTAAIEGLWDTQRGAPFIIFAIPDQLQQKNLYSLAIPYAASLINTHQLKGEMLGLKTVSPSNQPYVPLVFFSFRIMVGIGLLMVIVALIGLWLFFTQRLYTSRWFLTGCIFMSPTGFIALLAGWITSETGRQPWIVYDLIRTHEAVAKITLSQITISFVALILVYLIIFCVFYIRYLGRILRQGPTTEVVPNDSVFRYLSTTEIK